jgi:hypothetical protein
MCDPTPLAGRLDVMVREDVEVRPGDLTGVLATLLLSRARQAVSAKTTLVTDSAPTAEPVT